jgi:hypothetical protein
MRLQVIDASGRGQGTDDACEVAEARSPFAEIVDPH